jgi:hypothetical protein
MRAQKQVTHEELERERRAPPLVDRFRYAKSSAMRRWSWLPKSQMCGWDDFHQEIHLACLLSVSTRFALRRAVDRAMNALAVKSGFVRINGKYTLLRARKRSQRLENL